MSAIRRLHLFALFLAFFMYVSARPGAAACTKYSSVSRWDTCSSLAVTNGLHLDSLHKLNPALDCSKHLPDRLCVADNDVDLPPTCGKWDEVQYDRHGNLADGCTPLAVRNQISDLRYLYALNPGLDCRKLVPGELVCVERRATDAQSQQRCIRWDEFVGDGQTDPCAGKPVHLNAHLRCGKPLVKGLEVMVCSDAVNVPPATPTCTRYETFTVDGKTNYCQIKGGKDKMPALVKHLQLNDHLYCSAHGTVDSTVLLCMEGYVQTVEEDVSSPGSPTRDHLMLKLFEKLNASPRLPPLDFSGGQDPFQGGTRGPTATHSFMHAARKLPPDFSSTAAGLIHLAGAAIRAYKAHGNQIMAQSAWGALVRVLALQDFSPDLFALQRSDPEFDTYTQHMLLNRKREVSCKSLGSAVARQPRLQAATRCFCDSQQHVLRCQTLLNVAMVAIEADKPVPSPHPAATLDKGSIKVTTPGGGGPSSVDNINPFVVAKKAAADAATKHGKQPVAAAAAVRSELLAGARVRVTAEVVEGQELSKEEMELAEKIALEMELAVARAVGGDPDLGMMGSEELAQWHDAHNTSMHVRHLLQPNTVNKVVLDETLMTVAKAVPIIRAEACKQLSLLLDEGVAMLKKAVATCTIKYTGDICTDDGATFSIQCAAIDLVIASVQLKITLHIAFPRQDWVDCRMGCKLMEGGYSAIGNPQGLSCPEACIRFINDGYLDSRAELQIDVCLGGSALNLIKWLDDIVPDFVEDLLGIKWSKLLCFTLMRGGLNFPNGLAYLTLLPIKLGIIETQMDFTLQVYRPWHYPEICDCNASPWACQPYCLKEPGGATFSGFFRIGIDVDLWLFSFSISKTWSWKNGFPGCGCPSLPPKVSKKCPDGQGITLPSAACGTCPGGMVAPLGATCYTCPAGTIPRNDRENCLYCAQNYIAAVDGATQCVFCQPPLTSYPPIGGRLCRGKCPPGTELIEGGTACTPCKAGTINPGTVVRQADLWTGRCAACGKGTAPNSPKTACDQCKPGYAATYFGAPACTRCPTGSIPGQCLCKPYEYAAAPAMQQVTATRINALLKSVSTSTAAKPAAAGAQAAGAVPISLNFAAFRPSFLFRYTTSTLVSNFLNKKPITAVPTGNNWALLKPDALKKYITPEMSYMLTCAKSYGCKACTPCPPGTYLPYTGALKCIPCAPGYYQPQAGQTTCMPCPAGTIAPTEGTANCITCEAGTFSTGCRPEWVFKRLPDMVKFAGNRIGLLQDLVAQPGGRRHLKQASTNVQLTRFNVDFSKTPIPNIRPTAQGCTECAKCLPGTVSALPKSTFCTACQPGSYQPQEGQAWCQLCPPGLQASYSGALRCTACNKGNMTDCGASKACNSTVGIGSGTCVACKNKIVYGNLGIPRFIAPEQCKPKCLDGYYRPPRVGSAAACVPCPPGFTTNNTATEQTACSPCRAGTYNPKYGQSCILCEKNTYNKLTGQISSAACLPCAGESYTLGEGATFCIRFRFPFELP